MNINQKGKLLVARIRFLKEEYEIVEETNLEALESFKLTILKDEEIVEKINKKSKEEEKQSIFTSEVIPPKPSLKNAQAPEEKRLYKKIALKTHPDKLLNLPAEEKLKKQKLFETARSAIQEEDYYMLFEVAKELDLFSVDYTQRHIDSFKRSVVDLENKIKTIKTSYPWVWYFSDESQKSEVLQKYKSAFG